MLYPFSARRISSRERNIQQRDWFPIMQTFSLTNHITEFLFWRGQIRPVKIPNYEITLHKTKLKVRQNNIFFYSLMAEDLVTILWMFVPSPL